MNTNEEHKEGKELLDEEAARLKVDARRHEEKGVRKSNKLWLWLGVLLLIFILLWWLWSIGTFEDLIGVTNG